jgi:fused signal recognition particle receptor
LDFLAATFMTKQNKLFSWLGFGKKAEAEAAKTTVQQPESPPEPQAEIASEQTENTVADLVVAEAQLSAALSEAEVATTEPSATETALAEPVAEQNNPASPEPAVLPVAALQPQPAERPGFFARLKQGLTKTSQNLGNGLASLFLGKKIDEDLYEELETQLLMADVGVDTSQKLIQQLIQHADRKQLRDADALYDKLQQEMALLLDEVEQPLQLQGSDGPFVILMVGVNGVGKTTTIGKMAQQFKQQGKSVMLAAGDTFRAAAVEQLQVWGERNAIPVIAQHSGADSASVIFDAYQAAKARGIDVLIADTAGRLQNKAHLMEELKKIVRVLKKIDVKAPHEVMLTLDAGTGQNALSQARLFKEAVDISGISLTKLDGTAKGGVIFAIADQFKLPIRYIGVGEGIDDLRVFDSKDFIKALFARDL